MFQPKGDNCKDGMYMNYVSLIKALVTTVLICIPVWVCVLSVLSETKETEDDEI